MLTYTTLSGQVLDLGHLRGDQLAFFEQCLSAYRGDTPWEAFFALVTGAANPLVRSTGGVITRDVAEHPVYRAARDLEARLGIKQGKIAPSPGDDVTQDPINRLGHSVLTSSAQAS